jgi:hypothetical protein
LRGDCFVDIGRIVDHHCLEVIVCFLNIGRIVDHHSPLNSDGQHFYQYQQNNHH